MKCAAMLCTLMLCFGCQTAHWKSDPPAKNQATDRAAESFANLVDLSSDPVRFNQRDYDVLIDSELTRLSQLVNDGRTASRDPADGLQSEEFSSRMLEAKHLLRVGNRTDARLLINNATKVSFDFATGRFDEGLKNYFASIDNPDKLPAARLELLTLRAMSVAIRVKEDPKLAERIAVGVMRAKWAPMHLQLGARRWLASIRDWTNEKPSPDSLNKAKRLLTVAWNRRERSPLSHSGLIEALRASAILHRQLESGITGRFYTEALYWAGLTAEVLWNLDPAPLSEVYYSACIQNLPHSDISKQCYLRLEGFEVAGGNVYDKVRSDMNSLKKLAAPNEEAWLEWGKDQY